MAAPIVHFDVAGPDDDALRAFYSNVFGWSFTEGSQARLNVHAPLDVTIRRDPAEKRIYLGVPDVASSLESVEANGGSVDQPRFEVPGVAVLGLFRDPAGNPMGLVELDDGRPRVP